LYEAGGVDCRSTKQHEIRWQQTQKHQRQKSAACLKNKKNKKLWLALMWDRTGAKEKSGQLLGSKDEAHASGNKSRA
jgi:hypothetical protein